LLCPYLCGLGGKRGCFLSPQLGPCPGTPGLATLPSPQSDGWWLPLSPALGGTGSPVRGPPLLITRHCSLKASSCLHSLPPPQVWEEGQTFAEQSCGAQGGAQPPPPGLRPHVVCPLGTVKLPPPSASLVSLNVLHRAAWRSPSPALTPLLPQKGLSWSCCAVYANECKFLGPRPLQPDCEGGMGERPVF